MARSSEPLLLLDTHVWLWEVFATGQLSSRTRALINEATGTGRLQLSMISVWEISLLAARSRIELGRPIAPWFAEAARQSRIVLEPVSVEIAIEAGNLPEGFRSDPADLIIVATARASGATLITRDRKILDYAARGHLNALRA